MNRLTFDNTNIFNSDKFISFRKYYILFTEKQEIRTQQMSSVVTLCKVNICSKKLPSIRDCKKIQLLT